MTHQPLSVAVQRLDPDLPLPATARNGDAGVDLYARENAMIPAKGGRILMPTGLAIAIPLGFAGFVVPRSGLALKHGITLVNTPGIIDSGYRGEDNRAIFSEITGLSSEEIVQLENDGVLVSRGPSKR